MTAVSHRRTGFVRDTKVMIRKLSSLLVLLPLLLAGIGISPALAADMANSVRPAAEIEGQVVNLGLNKSMIVDLPEDVRDVLVSNPAIADAVVRSNRKIYVIGMAVGEANIFVFGAGNRQIAHFELVVGRDTVGLEATIASVLPNSAVHAQSLGDSLVLSGTVNSPEAAAMAANIAAKFIGSPEKVVNSVTISGSDQVNLRVVIAEVEKNTSKQLGIDLVGVGGNIAAASVPSTTFTYNMAGIATDTPSKVFGIANNTANGALLYKTNTFQAMIDALKTEGVLRSLAEPNLTAISGQEAKFVVGGEIPYYTVSDNGTNVNFKEYGIQLEFTPVVLSSGRINLKINTIVSDIDTTHSTTSVLALTKRSAETTVELPSGGAIALGGLLKDSVNKSVSGLPMLSDVPILGALFKSQAFKRSQTELVIFVTPYIVKPVATSALQRPDQNLNFQTDSQSIFLNQINKIYNANGVGASGAYQGRYGFAYD
jgi:pilus assembly protein CpaC